LPLFAYEALNSVGKSIHGVIDADSPRTARSKLRSQGVFPTEIREEGVTAIAPLSRLPLMQRVRPKDLALAFRQLATLIEAGIPLVSSLSALTEQLTHPVLSKVLAQIKESVREGNSFAQSLAAHPSIFSPLFVGMVKAGEISGTLGLTLSRWADFSERQVEMRQKIRAAMTYPIFMLIIGIGILFFLMTFVVPTVTKIFADLGQALPLPSRILIQVSGFLNHYWWACLAVFAGVIFWVRKTLRQESGALYWDRLKLKLPLAGPLWKKLAIARWARTLGTLLSGGVPLLQGLEFSQGVVGNRLLLQALEQARERVREGEEMAFALRQCSFFPSVVLEMVAVGEKSGELQRMLERIAQSLENEVEGELRGLMALLEPIMILVMGVGVGFIALAILLPILEMSQMVR
jgi:general secretion pathway protein F